ncbi:MAG: ATP-binding protein [Chitinophagaceae bacterium]
MNDSKTYTDLLNELGELHHQLAEANETLYAIKTGQIDAIFVENEKGRQLYTLKTADQTYRVFIEKMKEGAVTLNKDEIILYCNSQFSSMTGLPSSKVIGVPLRNFIPGEYLVQFQELLKKGWLSDSKGELPLQNKEGALIPVLFSFSSLEMDEGTSLSVILTDLSIQKAVEKELQLKNKQLEEVRQKVWTMNERLEDTVEERTRDLLISREHFKFLSDNIPVIVWTTLPDGTADYFNKRWYEYTGLTLEESIGAGTKEVLYPDDYEPMLKAWTDAIQQKKPFEFEYRIRRAADGQFRWFLGKCHPLKDEGGKVLAWFGTSTEIEDQKKEMERKDEFIGVASHELKTPLTSLKGYIQLMELQENLPVEVNRYIHKANESVTKLQHLINDLLDVSKIQAGKLKFDMQLLDLKDIIHSSVENSTHIYSSHTFKKENIAPARIKGNAERIEQVLMNLISNAVKYSPNNKEVVIQSQVDKNTVTISVTDFGIGMSGADQKRVFERFYRVDNSNLFTSGLGMGLYISAEIIREHNGKMKVKSSLGKGSTISFTLPLSDNSPS